MSESKRKVDAKGRVILPDRFAGQTVTVEEIGDTEVRVRLARQTRERPSLKALLSRVTRANLPEKVDLGPPAGDEQQ